MTHLHLVVSINAPPVRGGGTPSIRVIGACLVLLQIGPSHLPLGMVRAASAKVLADIQGAPWVGMNGIPSGRACGGRGRGWRLASATTGQSAVFAPALAVDTFGWVALARGRFVRVGGHGGAGAGVAGARHVEGVITELVLPACHAVARLQLGKLFLRHWNVRGEVFVNEWVQVCVEDFVVDVVGGSATVGGGGELAQGASAAKDGERDHRFVLDPRDSLLLQDMAEIVVVDLRWVKGDRLKYRELFVQYHMCEGHCRH